jgi:phosphoribosylformylglycinamidine cyclo-ligase
MSNDIDSYEKSGVKIVDYNLWGLKDWINQTFFLNENYPPLLDLGYFANVIRLSSDISIAISTDGVGTKLMIAQMLDKYDTVGIDLVAMSVNDILCVGAEPVTFVDYIAVQGIDEVFFRQIGQGLYEGSKIARVSIPGGEIAQIKEIIKGVRDNKGFDLVGTCVGILKNREPIIGQDVCQGDMIIGLSSSGLHSNGYSLARRVLFQENRLSVDQYVDDLKRTLGEELLEPTHIYVPEIMEILSSGIPLKALINITGDGIFNIKRIIKKDVGFVFHDLFEPLPVFEYIKKMGNILLKEMYQVFNMGMGFAIILDDNAKYFDKISSIVLRYGINAKVVGKIIDDTENKIRFTMNNLKDIGSRFE